MNFIIWIKEILKISPYAKRRLTAYSFGKHDVKFELRLHCHPTSKNRCSFLYHQRGNLHDTRVSHFLTFGMLDTSHIVTPFTALWSYNVAKTVIMLPAV